jgi:hypothetical protein
MHDEVPAAETEKPIPLWTAFGVLAAIVIGGGTLIYKYLYRPPAPPAAIEVVTPGPGQPRVARSGGNAPATAPALDLLVVAREADLDDGVHRLPAGGTLIKAADAYVKAFDGTPDAAPSLSFGYFTVSQAQWEHGYLSNGVRRLSGDGEYAKSLGVTAEQLKKLEDLPPEPPMRWDNQARDRFSKLYAAWRSAGEAQRSAAAGVMVRQLAEYARGKRDADDAMRRRRVERIRSVLTPDQVRAMNPIPRWDLPTTRATPR